MERDNAPHLPGPASSTTAVDPEGICQIQKSISPAACPQVQRGQLNVNEDRASACSTWQGRIVFYTMVLLLMLSIFQLGSGYIVACCTGLGVALTITAMLGLLVSGGYVLGYMPADDEHLLTQVTLVCAICVIAVGIFYPNLVAFCLAEDGYVRSPEDVQYVYIPQTVLLAHLPAAIHNHLIMMIAQLSWIVRKKLLRGARGSQAPRKADLLTHEDDTSHILTGSLSDDGIKSTSAHVPVGVV